MNVKRICALLVLTAILLSQAALAWFGETAAQREKIELEFRGIFILVTYSLLYGTFLGEKIGPGLLDLLNNLDALILMNPPLDYEMIHNVIRYFIILLQPLYLMAILGTGMYLIFFSGSPAGRLKAKKLLPVLVISMAAASMSLQFLRLLFNVSGQFAGGIINLSGVPIETLLIETINELITLFTASTVITFDGGMIFFTAIFSLILALFIFLALRYVALTFFSLVFPVGIFLYSFKRTRNLGRFVIEQTMIWSFAQIAIASIVVISTLAARFFSVAGDLKTIMGVAAFFSIIFSPILLIMLVRRFLP